MTLSQNANAERDKLALVDAQIHDVLVIAHDNVQRVMERGESLDTLQQRSDTLHESASTFHRRSRALRCRMCREYGTIMALIAFMLGMAGLIIWAAAS